MNKIQSRIERKYILPAETAGEIRRVLSFIGGVSSCEDFNSQTYDVLTAYFDDKELSAFNNKVDGEFFQSKIRIRVYGDSFLTADKFYIEEKSKSNELQNKSRTLFSTTGLTDGFELVKNKLGLALNHTCSVFYQRQAIDLMPLGIRMNLDFNITPMYPSELEKSTLSTIRRNNLHQRMILEVKTPEGKNPIWLNEILLRYQAERQRVSKYVIAFQSLYPQSLDGVSHDHSAVA